MVYPNNTLKPILKWVGGKRWLLPTLHKIWPAFSDCTLVEPFTGGMSVALGLQPQQAILNDANPHLINLYMQIKKGLDIKHRFKNQESYYYKMRSKFNHLTSIKNYKTKEAASIFYYLIKTGFNGLCRFNNNGEFNVPFGLHRVINYHKSFVDYKNLFKNWSFYSKDFEKLKLKGNEFLYLDPPYDVEFTKYHSKDFTIDDQKRLAIWLDRHNGPMIASNQATKRMLELYRDFNFEVYTINAPRRVSCTGDRKPALEMLAFKNISNSYIKNKIITYNKNKMYIVS